MSELKTKLNEASVDAFLAKIEPESRRNDAIEVSRVMGELTGEPAKMWGDSIVGFGSYHYVYASGREGDWMRIGFSPRKTALTLYIMSGFGEYDTLLERLGKYKTGKSCLYIKKLEDIDRDVLTELMRQSLIYMKKQYPN